VNGCFLDEAVSAFFFRAEKKEKFLIFYRKIPDFSLKNLGFLYLKQMFDFV